MDLLDQAFDATIDRINPKIPLSQRKKLKEAIEKIFIDGQVPHQAMGLGTDMLEHLYSYGNGLFSSGNYQKASDIYQALIYLNPTDSRFVFALAAAYHKMKKFREAVFAYVHSANLDKENPEPLYYMFDCFSELNLPQQALESLIECIKRCGDKKQNGLMKAKCLLIIKNLRQQVEAQEAKQSEQMMTSAEDKTKHEKKAIKDSKQAKPSFENRAA